MTDAPTASAERATRRGFLSRAAAGLAAAGTLPVVRAAAKPIVPGQDRWRMRLSTSSIHYLDLSVDEACSRIAELGFEAVDIWSGHQGCRHLEECRKMGASALVYLLGTHKLGLFAFSTYRSGYARYAELLGGAGGGVAVQGSAAPAKPGELTAKMKKFLETRKPLVELCEKWDSCLAIENHGGALLSTLDSLKAFVDLNTSPRLGIALAPYHVQGSKESVIEAIKICGKQLFYFYAWQRAPGIGQLPGHGPQDFTSWIRALGDVDYRGCVNPFAHVHLKPKDMSAALQKSKDHLTLAYRRAYGHIQAPP